MNLLTVECILLFIILRGLIIINYGMFTKISAPEANAQFTSTNLSLNTCLINRLTLGIQLF